MSWLDIIDGAGAIRTVYSNIVPSLESVRLHEVVFNQDGPCILLRLDLADFPSNPPLKWLNQRYNTVQLKLALDNVREVEVTGWGRDNIGNIKIQEDNPHGLAVRFTSKVCNILVISGFIRVDSISAYCDS